MNVKKENGKFTLVEFEPKYQNGILVQKINNAEELKALYNWVVDNNVERWAAVYQENVYDYDEKTGKPKNMHSSLYNTNPHYVEEKIVEEDFMDGMKMDVEKSGEDSYKVHYRNNDNERSGIIDINLKHDKEEVYYEDENLWKEFLENVAESFEEQARNFRSLAEKMSKKTR